MAYTTYTVKDGDRWDTIAFKMYGDKYLNGNPSPLSNLIEANNQIALDAAIPAGETLRVPIVEGSDVNLNSLPPWKR